MASQKLPVPYSQGSITALSKGSPAVYEGQHREMHSQGPGDPDQIVLCFNALELCGQRQLLGVFHINHRCIL